MERTNVNDVLARNLRALMEKKKITQTVLSAKSGVGQTTISLYLNPDSRKPGAKGKIPSAKLGEVASIAEALEVPIWELIFEDRNAVMHSGRPWPLSIELLAELSEADADTIGRVEAVTKALLDAAPKISSKQAA